MMLKKKITKYSKNIKTDGLLSNDTFAGYIFLLPNFLGFAVLTLFPVLFSLYLSVSKWDLISGFSGIEFVGMSNFFKLFSDTWFIASLKNNLVFTFTTVPIGIFLGLIFAVILNKVFFKRILQTITFIPYIASMVAVSVIWMVLLQPSYGPVNSLLQTIGIQNPPRWLGSTDWALPAIIIISIWRGLGYNIIICMAGIKTIPAELYESAKIDGASTIRQFFSITVPMVLPTLFFLFITGIIGSFKVFDQIMVLTEGGPGNSTSVMAYYIYKSAFEFRKMGYASAIAWVMFLLIFVVTIIQWRMQKKLSVYE